MISSPTTGSAYRQPSALPPAPSSTASEVSPSVRACRPSATSAAEPIRRPVAIRWRATHSLPTHPASAAPATAHRCPTGSGRSSRSTAVHPATSEDAATASTTATPARSSARPYPYV